MTNLDGRNENRSSESPAEVTARLQQELADQAHAAKAALSQEAENPLRGINGPANATFRDPADSARPQGTHAAEVKSPHSFFVALILDVESAVEKQMVWKLAKRFAVEDAEHFKDGEPGARFNRYVHSVDRVAGGLAYAAGAVSGYFCGMSFIGVSVNGSYLSASGIEVVSAGLIGAAIFANYLRFGSMHLVYGQISAKKPEEHIKSAYYQYFSREVGTSSVASENQQKAPSAQVHIGSGSLTHIGGDKIRGKSKNEKNKHGLPELWDDRV